MYRCGLASYLMQYTVSNGQFTSGSCCSSRPRVGLYRRSCSRTQMESFTAASYKLSRGMPAGCSLELLSARKTRFIPRGRLNKIMPARHNNEALLTRRGTVAVRRDRAATAFVFRT